MSAFNIASNSPVEFYSEGKCWLRVYRNSLFFRCKNISVERKCTKIFYANIVLQRNFFRQDRYVRIVMTQWWIARMAPTPRHCTAYRASSSQEQGTLGKCPMTASCFSTATAYLYVSHVGRLFPNRCCPYIVVHVVASNTTSYLLLTAASYLDLSI